MTWTGWPAWITQAPTDRRLYRLFNAEGVLLYLGVSGNPRKRLKRHWTRTWRDEVASATFEVVAGMGWDAEERAIRAERPLYNLAGVTVPYWAHGRVQA